MPSTEATLATPVASLAPEAVNSRYLSFVTITVNGPSSPAVISSAAPAISKLGGLDPSVRPGGSHPFRIPSGAFVPRDTQPATIFETTRTLLCGGPMGGPAATASADSSEKNSTEFSCNGHTIPIKSEPD
jgi:hypothetical protein